MASIVLSFVGNQDPFGNKTGEGSLVTLVKNLVEQGKVIKKVILIYTEGDSGTAKGAQETKDWLLTELGIDGSAVDLIAASQDLSDDPTNLFEAAKEARRGLNLAQKESGDDEIELNASSGTPAMKSSFTLLQAAGYIVNGQVWQVRDPAKMKEGQTRVFKTDGAVFRYELDLKVIKRQIEDHNYGGALESLRVSSLANDRAIALLEYGRCRAAFDFDAAFNHLNRFPEVPPQLLQEISALRQRRLEAIARELYLNATIRLRQRAFSEFLVLLTQFQECMLAALLKNELGLDSPVRESNTAAFWQKVQTVDDGRALDSLKEAYRDRGWTLELRGFPKRPHMMGLLHTRENCHPLLELLEEFNRYCEQRNRCVHRFEGVSSLENSDDLVRKMKRATKMVTAVPEVHWFEILNQELLKSMSHD
ncbi:MAG: hypothetical protein HC919_13320 [Oscillatoriales cyanobacterium SM2_2_1]|nr:hypothetical protein [Oscillatoriales cyanobacterium SM2_2_1]